jgi:hypothetical protein
MIIDGELDHLPESAFNLKVQSKKLSKQEKKCWQKPKKRMFKFKVHKL